MCNTKSVEVRKSSGMRMLCWGQSMVKKGWQRCPGEPCVAAPAAIVVQKQAMHAVWQGTPQQEPAQPAAQHTVVHTVALRGDVEVIPDAVRALQESVRALQDSVDLLLERTQRNNNVQQADSNGGWRWNTYPEHHQDGWWVWSPAGED